MCDYGCGLDGRTVARCRHKRRAVGRNRRLGRRRGHGLKARGYKQGWADERASRRASRRPKLSQNRGAKIAHSTILAHENHNV